MHETEQAKIREIILQRQPISATTIARLLGMKYAHVFDYCHGLVARRALLCRSDGCYTFGDDLAKRAEMERKRTATAKEKRAMAAAATAAVGRLPRPSAQMRAINTARLSRSELPPAPARQKAEPAAETSDAFIAQHEGDPEKFARLPAKWEAA